MGAFGGNLEQCWRRNLEAPLCLWLEDYGESGVGATVGSWAMIIRQFAKELQYFHHPYSCMAALLTAL